jgi:transcriptional regulator with XRE-family HTH domain
MQENKISAHALEKRAGLKTSAVHNILYGRSKNPSIHIIKAIAETLNCSIDDLLEQAPSSPPVNRSRRTRPDINSVGDNLWESSLYLESLELISHLLKDKNIQLNKEKILDYVDEVYLYSLKSGQNKVDKYFAEWIITKNSE